MFGGILKLVLKKGVEIYYFYAHFRLCPVQKIGCIMGNFEASFNTVSKNIYIAFMPLEKKSFVMIHFN